MPPLAHWRLYLGPPRITYHREEGRGGRTYFRIAGGRATDAQAQWVVSEMLQLRIPEPDVVTYKGDLEPVFEEVEEDDKVVFESNDSDQSIEDVQASYYLAGADRGFRNDPDDEFFPEVQFSGETEARLERMYADWELVLAASKLGRWARAGKKIGLAISYYALAHKVVYEGSAKFAELVRVPFAPVGREGFAILKERMGKLEQRSEEEIQWVVGGFYMLVKVLT